MKTLMNLSEKGQSKIDEEEVESSEGVIQSSRESAGIQQPKLTKLRTN